MEYNVNDVYITPTRLKAQREVIVLSLHSPSIPVMQTLIECALPPPHTEGSNLHGLGFTETHLTEPELKQWSNNPHLPQGYLIIQNSCPLPSFYSNLKFTAALVFYWGVLLYSSSWPWTHGPPASAYPYPNLNYKLCTHTVNFKYELLSLSVSNEWCLLNRKCNFIQNAMPSVKII